MHIARCNFRALVAIFASAALSFSSRAATIRDDEPDSGYLALGALADFTPVGTLVNSWGYTGCGILITPDWVLTAAHVLTAASSGTFSIGGISYTGTNLVHDPAWNGNALAGNDFGLMQLNTPVTNVAPTALYTGVTAFGQVATCVGYGFTGTGLTGWKMLDGKERGFQNVINTDFNNPGLVYGSLFVNPHSPDGGNALPLEGCVAPGDSGGGVFIQSGAQYYLAGVISFVASTNGNANSSYGNYSGFGPISAALPWVDTVVPEPAISALVLGSGLAALWVRRRKE